MENRFKFRAWDTEEGRYASDEDICFDTGGACDSVYDLLKHDDQFYVYEQSTGLKDKNGKLIYEGDILEINYYNTYWKVIYQEKLGKYCLDNTNGHLRGIDQFLWSTLKVIGNIHENPELLEE